MTRHDNPSRNRRSPASILACLQNSARTGPRGQDTEQPEDNEVEEVPAPKGNGFDWNVNGRKDLLFSTILGCTPNRD